MLFASLPQCQKEKTCVFINNQGSFNNGVRTPNLVSLAHRTTNRLPERASAA